MHIKQSLFVALLCLPLGVLAQPHPMPPHHHVDELAKALHLTAEQKNQLSEVFQAQHEKFRAIHEESHEKVKAILSPEQMAQWENLQQQRKEQRRKNMQSRGNQPQND